MTAPTRPAGELGPGDMFHHGLTTGWRTIGTVDRYHSAGGPYPHWRITLRGVDGNLLGDYPVDAPLRVSAVVAYPSLGDALQRHYDGAA